jgi:L,D-transpeptidase catalytic domain/Putative peptidoglycan binding domain
VKRVALAVLFVLGLAAAGGVSAGVGTSTSTTGTTGTTTETPVIAAGVTIGGVDVGGLTVDVAFDEVTSAFEKPLQLLVMRHKLFVKPERLGARALVRDAVARALAAPPDTALKLPVRLNRPRSEAYVKSLARHFDHAPFDAKLLLRNLRPWIARSRPGWALRRLNSLSAIFTALVDNSRVPVRLRFRTVFPVVKTRDIGPVIVIRRGSNRLYLYDGMRPWRVFGVATGQSSYPTPLGRWTIVVKWRNPWWYPPNSGWAKGAKPIPPGPGNPLGTRWMGLSASGVGIHGTPDDASIGYSASHGCIRMHIRDAEWLFNHVRIGTTVFIVSA